MRTNELAARLKRLESEIMALKTAKEKAAMLLSTVEYDAEIELTITRVQFGGLSWLNCTTVAVNTVSTSGITPLVVMYYGGTDADGRIFRFQRYLDFGDIAEDNKMTFMVTCTNFNSSDQALDVGESATITVPLKIVATAELTITTEEVDEN